MTFPKRDMLQKKEKLESDLVDLFKKTDSWSEFCIKAETHYGTDVSSFFGKWHIGYVALNVGRSFVIVPMMLISMTLTAVTAFFCMQIHVIKSSIHAAVMHDSRCTVCNCIC